MFKIKLSNARVLRGIIETLASIIDETVIEVTPKEFIISAMDPSRICLLKLSLKKQNFVEYKCNNITKVGLNLSDFDKIMKRCSPKDSLLITFNDDDNKIRLKMIQGKRTRTFSLTLLDIDNEEIPIDTLLKIEYPSKWVIEPAFLVEAIKDAEIYSEILSVEAKEGEGLKFSSTGQIGEMEYELSEEDLIESSIDGINTGSYSIAFLKSILKLVSITKKLEISLKTDHPLKMIFTLSEEGELSYFLAPRVEEVDFDEEEDFDDF